MGNHKASVARSFLFLPENVSSTFYYSNYCCLSYYCYHLIPILLVIINNLVFINVTNSTSESDLRSCKESPEKILRLQRDLNA